VIGAITDALTQARRLYTAIAYCSVHRNGTPNHESAGQVTGTGQGVTPAAARSAAYSDAQARVSATYGIGFHAQHCRYEISQ
jgi:hypothetical protein